VRAFANEPQAELRRAPVRDALRKALDDLESTLPRHVPVLVGGEHGADEGLTSTDPGDPARVVATAGLASASDVDLAVEVAEAGARDWGRRPASERAEVLVQAADVLRRRRRELAALQVRECAKPWPEADSDVCEAIDFLEYYARQALELEAGRSLPNAPGEHNTMRYRPRGVCAVIAPWNFPLAIPTGMTAGALASGNAAILKPAEQSPACGLACVQALREAGVPPAAIALLPGEGQVGAALVEHPGVATIAFTGSRPVGLGIVEQAAHTGPGQRHVKRVVSEMGGKNCVIVDSDADLNDVVPALVASAFAYGGQKCSAASRALVHEAIADELVRRLSGAVEPLCVGQAEDFATQVPPLIERAAQERVLAYQDRAGREGRLIVSSVPVPDRGWFVPPGLATELPAASPVLADEIFGPLLAIERVPGIEAACDVVDGLDYALTGGLYSRNPRTVEYVRSRTPVGNLYVNRQITGAMVGRQPFGGNRLSGTGFKAGGPDYLLQFTDPQVITEDTVRHGLVV
jgi:RHH-type transcriptional regulator, proline utilization regulon repressor / proline dehydrogenase / delta 1-pyrroline-5-carboxylate dehydrogenase